MGLGGHGNQQRKKPHISMQNSRGKKSTFRSCLRLLTVSTSQGSFSLCGHQHYISHCPEFKKNNPEERNKSITQFNLCFNCLRNGHIFRECPSKSKCQECKASHHTLFHRSVRSKRPNIEQSRSAEKKTRLEKGTSTSQIPQESSLHTA